jgi:hypothetical protein
MYLYYVQEGQQKISPTVQIDGVKKDYPDAKITNFKSSFEVNISKKFGKSKRTLQRYIEAFWSEENEFENHGLDGLVSKSI